MARKRQSTIAIENRMEEFTILIIYIRMDIVIKIQYCYAACWWRISTQRWKNLYYRFFWLLWSLQTKRRSIYWCNEAVTDFINDIQGRQSVNKDKSLQIQYISRDAVNWRQNIDSVNSKTDE